MVLLNAALGVALFVFFYSPPFTDLLPSVAGRHFFSSIPNVVRPLLLLAVLFCWLWARTPGKWRLVLARFVLVLPAVMLASTPLLPDVLMDKRWVIADGLLFLLAPVALVLVSPSLRHLGRVNRLLFVISLWLLSAAYTFLVFLLIVHADPAPLFLSFALVVLLIMAAVFLHGARPRMQMRFLTVFCILLCVAAALQALPVGEARTEASQRREDARTAALLTAGPYLQNLQPDGVTVMWETSEALPGEVIVSRTKEGFKSPATEGCRVVRDEAAVKIHEVRIDALRKDTPYYYQVVSNGVGSEIGSFQTAYEGDQPFAFAVYGDSQKVFDWAEYLVRNKHQEVCESIVKYSPEARFAVHVGDMTFLGNQHARWTDEFFGPARELMRNTVVWPVLGNHELNASLYFDYFSLPNEDEHYYSFNFGNSHFTVLAVEGYAVGHEYGPPTRTPMEPGSPQYAWLEQDLAKNQDKTWRFVFFHQSALSSGIEGPYTPARNLLIPLFEWYGVSAVFSGHDHDFECSIKDNIAYIVTGGGGGPVSSIALDAKKNPYSRYFRGAWHHCNVQVTGNRFEVKAMNRKGNVFYRLSADKTAGATVLLEE